MSVDAEHNLRVARAAMLQAGRGMTLAGTLITTTATVLVLWLAFGHDLLALALWYASHYLALGIFVVILVLNFPRDVTTLTSDQLRQWDYVGTAFSFLSGLLWGVGALIFIEPGNLELLLFLVAIFLGNGMGAMPMLCPFYPAFAAFILPMFSLFAGRLWVVDNTSIQVIGVLMFVYLVLLLYFGRILATFITRAITTDIENERLLEEVTRASRDRSRFLAAVSHDLRQPLAAIGLFIGVINKDVLDETNRNAVSNIDETWSALNDMCSSLLEISRLDAGAVEPQIEDIQLERLLERVAAEYRPAAEAKGLSFHLSHESPVVQTDVVLLERILSNLMSNAIKYTDKGNLSLTARTDDSVVTVAVSDTGRGIPASVYDAIFDEYYRHDPSPGEGLGLGLSVVQQLCQLLNYDISLQSEVGSGSTFTLKLPSGSADATTASTESETASIEGLHIAVIDDDRSVLMGMEALLERSGATVTSAYDAVALLEALAQNERPPDLLISDYRLDGETGIEAINRIRDKIDSALPALLMTADSSRAVREAAADARLMLLIKPVKVSHLLSVVSELV